MKRSFGNSLYQLAEGIFIAFDAIRTNKVRAGLTILGIAVGVFVVTVMSAAVHGINSGVSRSLAAAGPTTFFVSRWPAEFTACDGGGESCPWIRFRPLTLDQAREIERLPMIKGVSGSIETSAITKYADRELPGVSLTGNSTTWFDMAGGDISSGRNFTESEYEAAAPVVLVNDKVVERLFNGEEAVGKEIRLNGELFTVIGVYNPIPNFFDSGDKGKLIVPITTAQRRLNVSLWWLGLTVKPRDGIDRDA